MARELVVSQDEAKAFAERLGFPILIEPIAHVGWRHQRVDRMDTLMGVLDLIPMSEFSGAYLERY